jgi:uncharacterized protein (DUF885 family)
MTSAGTRQSGTDLRAFFHADWDRWVQEYPEFGTVIGAPGVNGRWTDDSPEGIGARKHHLAESLRTLESFGPPNASSGDRLNYELYRGFLTTAQEGLAYGVDPFPFPGGSPHNLWTPVNQLEGIQVSAGDMVDLQPHASLSDYRDLLARLRGLPAAIEQTLALLRDGAAHGYVPARVAIQGVPAQIARLASRTPGESALLSRFEAIPESIPDAERGRLRSEADAVFANSVAPALDGFGDYFEHQYLPACRTEVGVSALPRGAAAYRYLIRNITTTDLAPERVHEIGLVEVHRLEAAMRGLMGRTGFPGSFPAFLEFLRKDPRFFFTGGEQLVDGYRVIAKRIDPELGRLFGRLPRLPYGVRPVPAFREASSPAAYYYGGAASTGRPGWFFANTFNVGVRPRWEMEALTLHEAVPGHHLQIALAQELDQLPEFRRETGPTAFVEGWGLYAESLGPELGCYTDPYSEMGQLVFDMWRSIRLVVDTGMHAQGWTREQAIQFFRERTGMSDTAITVEVDRYIVWPAQALAYKIGQLKFRELRTRAEQRLGARFDVRAFHDVVLGEGALPLHDLERRVDAWIDAQRTGDAPSEPVESRGPSS